jgi:Mu-like prophage major head subunit gpT
MVMPVIAGPSFTAGLRTEFLNTYAFLYDGIKGGLSKVMRLGIPSDKNLETYFYWKSAPHVKRWIRGMAMPTKNFQGVQYTAQNYEWAMSIPWHFADRQDDQTRSLPDQARKMGKSFALLEERVFFEIVTGTASLLPAIPNAADGAALFATTASGANRFGASGGNSLTGAGTSVQNYQDDFLSQVMPQFRKFQDTEGQPLWDEQTLDGNVKIFFSAGTNEENFKKAFAQGIVHSVLSATGAGVSNVILDAGYRVKAIPTQRLTGNSWFSFLEDADVKAIFSQLRQPVSEIIATFENSDMTRTTGKELFAMWARYGFGINTPYAAIKVFNS